MRLMGKNMRYITKCANSEGRRLTTPLKVWRHCW